MNIFQNIVVLEADLFILKEGVFVEQYIYLQILPEKYPVGKAGRFCS